MEGSSRLIPFLVPLETNPPHVTATNPTTRWQQVSIDADGGALGEAYLVRHSVQTHEPYIHSLPIGPIVNDVRSFDAS